MRAVNKATCTLVEPVSPSVDWYSLIIACVSIDIINNSANSADVDQDISHNDQVKQVPITDNISKEDQDSPGLVGNVGKIWSSAVKVTEDAYDGATDSVATSWTNFKQKVDPKVIKTKIDALEKKLSEASTYLVNLAIIFVFQTIVSPLIVLLGLIKIAGAIIRSKG
jgi:hypothetical protein